jgi:hypothetical protein
MVLVAQVFTVDQVPGHKPVARIRQIIVRQPLTTSGASNDIGVFLLWIAEAHGSNHLDSRVSFEDGSNRASQLLG